MQILGPDGRPLATSGEKKALSTTELILLEGVNNRTPRAARRLARESYSATPYTFRAINVITTALSSIPIELVSQGPDGDEPVERHPALEILRRPNPKMGGTRLLENLVAYKKLAGSSFLLQMRQGDGAGPPLRGGLYVLRPDRMTVVMDESDLASPEAFVYRPDEGDVERFSPDEVLMLKGWNPLDDVTGLSEVVPSAGAVDQLNESQTWNNNLLRNGGKPSAVVIAKHELDPMQRAQLEEWTARQYGGAHNAGRIAVIEGTEIDWRELGFNARDLDYLGGREMSAIEVGLAHGVPPELLGVGQKTFQNYKEARKALYVETVRPELEYVLSELNAWWIPMFGDENLRLVANYGVIEELASDAQAEYKRISEAFDSGWLTVNDARREAEMPEVDESENLFRYQQEARSRGGGAPPPEVASAGSRVSTKERKARIGPDEARRRFSGPVERFRSSLTAEVATITTRAMERQQDAVAAVLRDAGSTLSAPVVGLVAEALDDPTFRDQMRASFVETTSRIARVADRATEKADAADLAPLFTLLRRDQGATRVDLDLVESSAERYVVEALSRDLSRIQKTTQGNVLAAIRRSLERGDSLAEIAANMDEIFASNFSRIPMIAQTEAVGMSNGAIDTLARALGTAPVRMWVSQDDARVRPSHVEADGQRVELLGNFLVGGSTARFPGDPLLPPAERINCRCFALHLDEAEGET